VFSRTAVNAWVIAASLLQPSCTPPPEATNFHLATVAAAPEHGLLFVAQPGRGAVDVLALAPEGRRNEAPRFVATLLHEERNHVLRLAVDRERGRLWIADVRVVQVYGLARLEVLHTYRFAGSVYYERFSDLALDRAGNAWLLSRGGARIHRIEADSLDLEHWLDVGNRASDLSLLLANRALASPDGSHLFLAAPTTGNLLRVDLNTKSVLPVTAASANLTCGLLFWEQGSAAIRALDCTGRWQAEVSIAASLGASAMTLRGSPPALGSVTAFAD
jgi:hypothetical protein